MRHRGLERFVPGVELVGKRLRVAERLSRGVGQSSQVRIAVGILPGSWPCWDSTKPLLVMLRHGLLHERRDKSM